jgi:hypothetical protein
MAESPAQGDNVGVAELSPNVKRYALVPHDSNSGMRRFHLARVASAGRVPDAQRLERMEDVAAQEHEREEAQHESQPGVD